MSENAVIDGTYSDFKLVKTRSVFQMVIEGPIERAAEAIAMFGVPQPGREIHVAIARLEQPVSHESPAPAASYGESTANARPPTGAVPGRDAARERGRERYLMGDEGERAVIRAGRLPKSQAFLDYCGCTAEQAAQIIRDACRVKSRSEIASNEDALRRFIELETTFQQAIGQLAEVRS